MKTETVVEFLIKYFDVEMQDILHLDKINQAKEMEKNQKMDFANWCRIHDNKYPNTVMTIQQLYDKYEQELGSELESANSSERKNTLSDYGVAGEDNSIEYDNENKSDTESIQWTGDNFSEILESFRKYNVPLDYQITQNKEVLTITKNDWNKSVMEVFPTFHILINKGRISVLTEEVYQVFKNQQKTDEMAKKEEQNNPEPSTPKIRLQTALDIFELEESKMEAFGIRTPKEFEDYREQRKQLYEKCKIIEQAEREKLIREACLICKTAFRGWKKTTVGEVVNQVLNK